MRLWQFKATSRPKFYQPGRLDTDYQELYFDREREAFDFAWILAEEPRVLKVEVRDRSGRVEPFMVRAVREAA